MSGEPQNLPFYLDHNAAEDPEESGGGQDELALASTTNVIQSSMLPIKPSRESSPETDVKSSAKKKKEKMVKVKTVPPSEQRSKSKAGSQMEGSLSRRGSMRFSTSGVYAFNVTPTASMRRRSQSMADLAGGSLTSPRSPLANTTSHLDLGAMDLNSPDAYGEHLAHTPTTPQSQMVKNLDAEDGESAAGGPVVVLNETDLYVQQVVAGGVGSPRQRAWSRNSGGSVPPDGSPTTTAGGGGRQRSSSASPTVGSPNVDRNPLNRKTYKYQKINFKDEVDRYSHDEGGGDDDEGECGCDYLRITRDTRGFDYSRYHAHHLYQQCVVCQRQPASFLCLHDLQAVCPSHVATYTNRSIEAQEKCTLYINIQEIVTSFDRIFWCERCKRFTWKFTEEYEPFTDQIAVTKGTYLDLPVTDLWIKQYMTKINQKAEDEERADQERQRRRKASVMECADGGGSSATGSPTSPPKIAMEGDDDDTAETPHQFLVEKWNKKGSGSIQSTVRALGASMQGWRSGQEDAEAAFTIEVENRTKNALDCSCSIFCVFDGHGGDAVAKIAARDIKDHLTRAFNEAPPLRHGGAMDGDNDTEGEVFNATGDDADIIQEHFTSIFRTAFMGLDKEIQDSEEGNRGDFNTVGCTACIVAITEDFIICANLGDSGAVLFHPAEVKRRRMSLNPMSTAPSGEGSPNAGPPGLSAFAGNALAAAMSSNSSPDMSGRGGDAGGGKQSTDSSRRPSASVGSQFLAPPSSSQHNTIAVVPLSKAHRLSDSTESDRVKAAGYTIQDERIEGMLAVPRALGDYDFKMCGGKSQAEQAVSSCPDVVVLPKKRRGRRSEFSGEVLEEKDWTILVGCDGIWDTLPRDDVCRLAHQALYVNKFQDNTAGNTSFDVNKNNSIVSTTPHVGGGGLAAASMLSESRRGSNAKSSGTGEGGAHLGPPSCIDQLMLNACNSILDHCIAPSLNDQGLGMDNMSLIIMRPTSDEIEDVQIEVRQQSSGFVEPPPIGQLEKDDDDTKSDVSL